MKRSFTLLVTVLSLLATSSNSFGQCFTGGSFTVATNNSFVSTTEAFSGDFYWSANGSGQLESTGVDMGTSKVLNSATLYLPESETTMAWSFDLSGTANVVSYNVLAEYYADNVLQTVEVCS